jgi:hypothetical protein
LALGAIFFSKNRPKFTLHNKLWIWATFCHKVPQFDQILLFVQKLLFTKAPFWAKFGQILALFFAKRLVTLVLGLRCNDVNHHGSRRRAFCSAPGVDFFRFFGPFSFHFFGLC